MLLLADTGLRPGEACAIQWDDLDGTNRTLRIARSVENSGRVKTIKTDKSRTVDLSARLTSALIAFQASLEADAMVDGKDTIEPLVFATKPGTPPRPRRLAKAFKKVVRAAGLPLELSLYSLRHTYVSHLIAAGAPITYIGAQVGHSRVTTTLTYYAHLFPNGDRRHVDQMERVRLVATPLPIPALAPDDGVSTLRTDDALTADSRHRFGTSGRMGDGRTAEVMGMFGEPSGTRTRDPLIKSQVLYRLS